jgi:hypothetical protein
VLVLSDGSGVARGGEALAREVRALAAAGVRVTAVGAGALRAAALAPLGDDVHPDGTLEERVEAVEEAVPPPGDVVLEDVELQLGSVPAPARLLEVSGGAAALALDIDRFFLGDLVAGEARTEVARLSVPPWVPGEPLELTLTASYRVAATGERQTAEATLRCRYTDSVTQLANNRHGDVIAYASGLAMVRRLHRAFLGSALDSLGGLRPLVALQSRSLAVMAVDQHDPALRRQAEVLSTLLGVLPD